MASSVPDISTMTVPQLKEQLRERGLPVSGAKAVLIARLTPELKLLKTRETPTPAKAKASATTTELSKRVSSGVTAAAAGRTVVVVESPAKCKTISKFLGPNFDVLASYGHVRRLPPKPGSVLPAQNFAMTFEDSIQPKARSLRPCAGNACGAQLIPDMAGAQLAAQGDARRGRGRGVASAAGH